MIYCVVPPELAEELFDRLVAHYADNPAVTVIIDRRVGADRRSGRPAGDFSEQRITRDRRRPRVPGTFADVNLPSS
ncbi:MAG: hypothetical protein WCH31_04170 [Actinomycetes bacterium]